MNKLIAALLVGGVLSGCTQYVTKHEFAPAMYEERPVAILVLPPINKSTAADAKEYYTTTIAEPLTNMGYYVFPIEVVNEVLKQEGLFDTETMFGVPPQKFKEYFGADAVMYVTIHEWNTQYLVTSGSVTVKIASELRSTSTGEVIWFYDDRVSVSTTGESGGATGLAGLLVQAVATAIKTAVTEYVALARQANSKILLALPYGKYNKEYGKDRQMKIEKKTQGGREGGK